MRHNKIIGWDGFLGLVEQVQKVSPWLSRQMIRRAAEWPFWFSGVEVREWQDGQAWIHLSKSARNTIEGEICQGHLLLGAELCLRLILLRFAQEMPFRFRLISSRVELHHLVDQSVDYKFSLAIAEWEKLRLELMQKSRALEELVFSASLSDGRLACTFTFQVAFELEKFLPA